jgi:hypothetical protein
MAFKQAKILLYLNCLNANAMNNTSFTEQDYEQMGRATFRSAVNSLQEQLPELRQKAKANKFGGLKEAIEQAYQRKMERRNQALKTGTTQKTKSAVQPAAAKTTATKQPGTKPAPKNTAVNWELINNLPHNRDADNATYSEKDGFTRAELELTKNL